MNRRELLRCGALGATTSLLLSSFGESASAAVDNDLARNLGAPRRRKRAIDDEQAGAFDQFIGTWDVAYTDIAEDGSRETLPGQLIFGWILDGEAIQDIWIQQSADRSAPPFKGTSIRFYDPAKKVWRTTWVAPSDQAQLLLEGRWEGNTITLLGETPKGRLRWSFHDIEANRFTWLDEHSTDQGKTWRLVQSCVMRRVSSG